MSLAHLKNFIESKKDEITNTQNKVYKLSEKYDLFDLYLEISINPKVYFKSKDGKKEFLGLGYYKFYNQDSLLIAESPIFYNKVFDELRPQTDWSSFGKHKIFTCLLTIEKSNNEYLLYINNNKADFSLIEKLLTKENEIVNTISPELSSTLNIPGFDDWDTEITNSITKMKQDLEFEKVVFARKFQQFFTGDINHPNYIRNFVSKNGNKFIYLFNFDKNKTFISISPESLLKIENKKVSIDIIAGTRSVEEDEKEDRINSTNLKNDKKEIHEHNVVASQVEQHLDELCLDYKKVFDKNILKQKHVQHLHSLFVGTLKTDSTINKLVEKLHPTPAVGGTPQKTALEIIRNEEQFDRGLYAAPCGIITKTYSELLVAIRSAFIEKKSVSIYAGAGIVEGSQSKNEWKETQCKMKNFLLPV